MVHENNINEVYMKSITIHGIDDVTAKQLEIVSEQMGLSLNKTIKKLLHEVLGIKPADISSRKSDFEEFCGVWSKDDIKEFNNNTESLEQIEPGEWR